MRKDYYVYVHYCQDKCIYCGMGRGERCYSSASRNPDWWDKVLIDNVVNFEVEIIYKDLTKEEAAIMETTYIREYGLDALTNRRH